MISLLKLDDNTEFYVETLDCEDFNETDSALEYDLPPGAQLTSKDASRASSNAQVETAIKGALNLVKGAVDQVSPNEWGVELSLGFAGEAKIPFLVAGKTNAAIKVHAKWVKPSSKNEESKSKDNDS